MFVLNRRATVIPAAASDALCRVRVGWFLLLCLVGSHRLLGQPAFFRKDIPVASPASVLAGDFNGDRRPDLAVYLWYEGVAILLNAGGGDLGRPIQTGVEMRSFRPGLPVVADFNGDGRDDLVTSEAVLLSHGDGTFQPASQISNAAAVGDFNGDRRIDLVAIEPNVGARVLLGNGDGSFQSGAALPARGARAVVADFNRDGRSDLVLDAGVAVSVFLGKGDGTFGAEVRTPLSGMPAMLLIGLLVADFNGDGLPDLAAEGGIALGKGDGSFQSLVPYPFSGRDVLCCLAAGDFTADGKADLVMGRIGTNSISIFPGKGDGTFLPPVEQSVGWNVVHPAAAVDLDGDGRLDLVLATGSNTLSLLMARAPGGPGLRRAVSAASGMAIVAPGSLATLLAPTTVTAGASASPPWPTLLGGLSLEVRDSAGATRLAPLLYVSPTQINFQVPAGTALGEATLAIASGGGTTQVGSMQVDAVAPGLFMLSPGRLVPAATGVLVEPGGAQVPIPAVTCFPAATGISCALSPIPLSAAGDRPIYLSFYGTGFRGGNPNNVTCSISGVRVPVVYAGPQGTPGLEQINVRLLPEVFPNMGYEVIISIDGMAANAAYIDIQ